LKRGKLEACIYVEGDVDSEDPVIVEIVYDETRPGISQIIINEAQSFLGSTSGDLSEQGTEALVNELNSIISFAREVDGDLAQFIVEAKQIRTSLIEAENSLIYAGQELDNQKIELVSTRAELNSIDDEELEQDEAETYADTRSALITAEDSVNAAIILTDDPVLQNELADVRSDLTDARSDLDYYHNQFQRGISALRRARITVDNAIDRIDAIRVMVDEEIAKVIRAQNDARDGEQRLLGIQADMKSRLPQQDFSSAFAKKIANPIEINVRSTLTDNASNIQKLFPLIAGTVAMFISLLLGNILTLSEIHSPAYLRTVISPLSRFWFILGIFVTNIILVFLQMAILFNTGAVNFGIPILLNIWYLIGFVFFQIMTFTLIGMLIAYLVNSEQTSILIATFAVLFLFLLSDAVFPVEVMPAFARFIADINPLMIFKELYRYSIFYQPNFLDMGWQLLLSGGYIVLGFFLIVLADMGFKRKNLK
jgi:ABC-2 type transport system permease protein